MKNRLIAGLCICLLLAATACTPSGNEQGQSEADAPSDPPVQSSTDAGDAAQRLEDARQRLAAYLAPNWGFREDVDILENGEPMKISGVACYAFDWVPGSDSDDRDFQYLFAIAVDADTVFFYNENDSAWVEDVNPEGPIVVDMPYADYQIGAVSGSPASEEEAMQIVEELLQHARCLAGDVLCVDLMLDSERQDEVEYDGDMAFSPVNPTLLPHRSVAEIEADAQNTFTSGALVNSNLNILSPAQYYRDFNGELYAAAQVGGISMAWQWDTDSATSVELTDSLIRVTMPVTVMDDTFEADLEAVLVDGQWLLNETYTLSESTLEEVAQSIKYDTATGELTIVVPQNLITSYLSLEVTGRLFDHEDSMKLSWSPFMEATQNGWQPGQTYTGRVQLNSVDYIEIAGTLKDTSGSTTESFGMLLDKDGRIIRCEQLPADGEKDGYYKQVLQG